ncbi:hypothetical protein KKC22_06650 [Myxococcota bacterium]|nr:hypothetical protein [Myxococcota bacterium]
MTGDSFRSLEKAPEPFRTPDVGNQTLIVQWKEKKAESPGFVKGKQCDRAPSRLEESFQKENSLTQAAPLVC